MADAPPTATLRARRLGRATTGDAGTTRPRRDTRWLLAAGLFLLAPMTAEYVTAYDPDSTGDPLALLGDCWSSARS